MITIDTSKIKAVFFDFNGTIVDTERIHYQSLELAFRHHGREYYSFDEHLRLYAGKKSKYIFEAEKEKFHLNYDVDQMIALKREYYFKIIIKNTPKPNEGFIELATALNTKGVKLAVVSGSVHSVIDAVFLNANMPNIFDSIVTIEEINKQKPNPACYLVALEKLRIPTYQALAFEDTENGIQAALNAGLQPVGFVKYRSAEVFKKMGENVLTIAEFTEVEVI